MKTADVKDKNNDLKIAKKIIFIKTFIVNFNCQQAWFNNVMYQWENHEKTCTHLNIENFNVFKISEM